MSGHGEKLSRIETAYCVAVATVSLGLIAAMFFVVEMDPPNLLPKARIVWALAAILATLFPAGIIMQISRRRKPIPLAVVLSIGLAGLICFLVLLANRRGYS